MGNIKKFLIALAVISLPIFFFTRTVNAQDTETTWDSLMETYDDFDYAPIMDKSGSDLPLGDIPEADVFEEMLKEFMVIFAGGLLIYSITIGLATYIYTALTLQKTAEKLNMENSWFAWLPILNIILLLKMGGLNPLYILFGLIPILGSIVLLVFTIIATMNICEKRGYDKMLGLLTIIPIGSLILWGILAWGKKTANSI